MFQIGATYYNYQYSDYYIDALGAATPTLYNLGHETGLFPDGTGTGEHVLNEPYDAGSVTNLNERSNLYLITQRAFDIDYYEAADQAFYCTTDFPFDGDPINDCIDDRLYLVYNAAGTLFSNSFYDDQNHVAPTDPATGVVHTPHVLINSGAAYRITTTGHELGHHLLHMASRRRGWSGSNQSTVTSQVHVNSGFSPWYYDCQLNSADGHSDWCLEFQVATTIEGWCDFHSHVIWFDRDAHQPGFSRSEPGKIDYWPEDNASDLAGCENPLEYTFEGYSHIHHATAAHIEGLAAKVWWDLYDTDQYHELNYGAGDYDENLNLPQHALHTMKVLDPISGLWVDQPMPRDNVSLPLGMMVDGWEELAVVEDGWNGSRNEAPMLDQTGICWGSDTWDQLGVPGGVEFATIGSGRTHSCGIDEDGGLHCWGDNSRSQLEHPDVTAQYLSVGSYHSCVIDELGNTECWGYYKHVPPSPPQEDFISLSLHSFSCGVTTASRIVCWDVELHENLVPPDGEYRAVAVGFQHACAITTDDEMVCWGWNIEGQLEVPDIGKTDERDVAS